MNSSPSHRQSINEHQSSLLSTLVRALMTNRFYAPRIEVAGFGNGVIDLELFRERMAYTTKSECVQDQADHPPYGTNLTFPLDHYTRFHSTSGTTGSPLRWLDTPESWQGLLECWKKVFLAAGATQGDRVMFAFSFGPFLGFWTAFEAASQLGMLCLPGGGLSSEARLRLMLDNEARILCCTPTYAIRLAEIASEKKIDIRHTSLERIIVAGEPGGSVPATRARIESLWPGARVCDHHGMTEVGPVTYECPARPCTLRVIEEDYLAEIIDPKTEQPVAEGETGELVLTTLRRIASPLLRYRTGDLVKPRYFNETGDGPGEHLCLEGGILGRVDDMVLIRGVNVYPSAVDQIIRTDPRVAEYRVEIDTRGAMAQMAVWVEPTRADMDGLTEDLESAFRNQLSLRVQVKSVECGSLPRFEMKAKRWVRYG